MRKLLFLVLLGVSAVGRGNMSQPTYDGSLVSAPFINQHVNIIHENIFITPKSDLTAFYKIEYQIESLEEGINLPFIFYALDYRGEFKIWVDSVEVRIDSNIDIRNENDYLYSLDSSSLPKGLAEPSFWFWENMGQYTGPQDLKYFTTNLSKGKHIIVVEYYSTVWVDLSDWVKEYSFRYSLSPARKWKSFGTLDVSVDCTEFGEHFVSNLDSGLVKSDNAKPLISHYHFNKIPADFISLTWIPKVGFFANALIFIGPFGLMLILFFGLVYTHFRMVRIYRRNNLYRGISVVVALGSVLVPFLAMSSLFFFYPFIDWVIGAQASSHYGYFFFVFVLYPIVLPIYWLCMIGVDRYYKERFIEIEKKKW
jgi:hypothetical protein